MSSRTAAKLRYAAQWLKPLDLTAELQSGTYTMRLAGMRACAREATVRHLTEMDHVCWLHVANPFERQMVRFMYLLFLAEYFESEYAHT